MKQGFQKHQSKRNLAGCHEKTTSYSEKRERVIDQWGGVLSVDKRVYDGL